MKTKADKKAPKQESLFEEEAIGSTLALVPEKPVKAKAKRKPKDPVVEYEKTSQHFLEKLDAVESKKHDGTLVDELKASIKKYLIQQKGKEAEAETTAMILKRIDHDGLSSPLVLGLMRDLQQAVVVRPGFLRVIQSIESQYIDHIAAG